MTTSKAAEVYELLEGAAESAREMVFRYLMGLYLDGLRPDEAYARFMADYDQVVAEAGERCGSPGELASLELNRASGEGYACFLDAIASEITAD